MTLGLYGLVPADFTAARNTCAKEAVSTGDRSLAAQIRQLPKPSASAWSLNLFAHDHPERVDEFAVLGGKLRSAQQNADRRQLDELMQQRKTIIREASKTIQAAATGSGVRVSPSALTEVEQSLQAALADDTAQAAVFSGRLVRAVQSDGLEPVDLNEAVAGPPLEHVSSIRGGPAKGTSASAKTATAKNARAKSQAALLVRTRRAVATADAALEAARNEEESLQSERDQLDAETRTLQDEFDELQRRRTNLDLRATEAAQHLRKAAVEAREAHAAADRATHTG